MELHKTDPHYVAADRVPLNRCLATEELCVTFFLLNPFQAICLVIHLETILFFVCFLLAINPEGSVCVYWLSSI